MSVVLHLGWCAIGTVIVDMAVWGGAFDGQLGFHCRGRLWRVIWIRYNGARDRRLLNLGWRGIGSIVV